MNTYNSTLETFNEQPTQEAIKAAEMVSRYAYWIANKLSQEFLNKIYGQLLGQHYWSKIVAGREKYGYAYDLNFWFELDNGNRQRLMHYLLRTGYKGK